MTDRVKPSPQVVDTELGDNEVALLDLDSKTYFSLNPTGARIWAGIKRGQELGEIRDALQGEFQVEAERAERGVCSLVEELLQQELVTLESSNR
ncbi:MAG: PqqD family protein [Ectothiorhodospiraceae bacterium]